MVIITMSNSVLAMEEIFKCTLVEHGNVVVWNRIEGMFSSVRLCWWTVDSSLSHPHRCDKPAHHPALRSFSSELA